jgi:hypothetical protein
MRGAFTNAFRQEPDRDDVGAGVNVSFDRGKSRFATNMPFNARYSRRFGLTVLHRSRNNQPSPSFGLSSLTKV